MIAGPGELASALATARALAPERSFADITAHPGGTSLSFSARSKGAPAIYLYDLLERVETLITDDSVSMSYPGAVGGHAWLSGDGGLVYVSADHDVLRMPLSAPKAQRWGPFSAVGQIARAADGGDIALVENERRILVVAEGEDPTDFGVAFDQASTPGRDYFVADPTLSSALGLVAFRHWRDDVMPWQASQIVVADFEGKLVRVIQEPGIMHSQPTFSPDGRTLGYITSRGGHLSIAQLDMTTQEEAVVTGLGGYDYGNVDQGQGQRSWCFDSQGGGVFAIRREAGFGRLVHHEAGARDAGTEIAKGFFDAPLLVGSVLVGIRQGAKTPTRLCAIDVSSLHDPDAKRGFVKETLAHGHRLFAEFAPLAEPRSVQTHSAAFSAMGMDFGPSAVVSRVYPPWTPEPRGTIAFLHGGPTDQEEVRFNYRIALFCSMGFTVVCPDFRGSTGQGMDFARALEGGWGLLDVHDVTCALKELEERGEITRPFVANGSSAGGYTALRLAQQPSLGLAGAILMAPVADLVAVDATTHRFERSLHTGLLGPRANDPDSWTQRSPAADPASISCPLLLMQGSKDNVVPPATIEPMVEELRAMGKDVEYLLIEGEGHSFRMAASREMELSATVAFLQRIAPER